MKFKTIRPPPPPPPLPSLSLLYGIKIIKFRE